MKIKLYKELTNAELNSVVHSDLYHQYNKYWNLIDENIGYQIEYNQLFEDLRFVVFDSVNVYLIAFFFVKDHKISFFDEPTTIIANYSLNNIDIAFSTLFRTLDLFKTSGDLKSITLYHDDKFISKYFDLIVNTKIRYKIYIDLSNSEEHIRRNIRKSYKSLLNWGQKNLSIKFYDFEDITPDIFYEFKDFHRQVSGRKTRSDISWELQYQTILNKKAFIKYAYYQSRLVSAIYIIYGSETAYYGIAVNDRELMSQNIPVGHYLLYSSILDCKIKDIKYFELGFIENNSENNNTISLFKKGFTNTLLGIIAHTIDFNDL